MRRLPADRKAERPAARHDVRSVQRATAGGTKRMLRAATSRLGGNYRAIRIERTGLGRGVVGAAAAANSAPSFDLSPARAHCGGLRIH